MPLIFLFDLITQNTVSNTRINKYAEIVSPWRVPFLSLKYWSVIPPLIIQDSWLFNKFSIHLRKFFLKPYFPRIASKNRSQRNQRLSQYLLLKDNLPYSKCLSSLKYRILISPFTYKSFCYIWILLNRNQIR